MQVNQKLYEKYISEVKEKFQTFHEEKVEFSHSDVCYDINWTYGIRIGDIKRVMKVIEGKDNSL